MKHASYDGPLRSMAVRSYSSPKVRGSDRERQAATAQERRPRGTTPPWRSGAPLERSYPTSQERLLRGWAQEGRGELSTVKVRRGGREKIPSSKVRSSGCALLERP